MKWVFYSYIFQARNRNFDFLTIINFLRCFDLFLVNEIFRILFFHDFGESFEVEQCILILVYLVFKFMLSRTTKDILNRLYRLNLLDYGSFNKTVFHYLTHLITLSFMWVETYLSFQVIFSAVFTFHLVASHKSCGIALSILRIYFLFSLYCVILTSKRKSI